jgi:hypothetical protein
MARKEEVKDRKEQVHLHLKRKRPEEVNGLPVRQILDEKNVREKGGPSDPVESASSVDCGNPEYDDCHDCEDAEWINAKYASNEKSGIKTYSGESKSSHRQHQNQGGVDEEDQHPKLSDFAEASGFRCRG